MGKRSLLGRRGVWNTSGLEPKLSFFNHRVYKAETRWQRREFIGKWRRIVAKDPRWISPHGPSLRRELRDPETHLIYVDALPQNPHYRGSSLESAVAAAIIRPDPLKRDTGYLSFLHTVNDRDTLGVLLESLSEHLRPHGIRTLTGPTHLFPHLGSGVLTSHWHLAPPLHTLYNPPYLNELCQSLMKPAETLQLHHLATDVQVKGESPASLSPLEPERLAQDLLPLLQVACAANPAFSPPDAEEAKKMLNWLTLSPLYGWLAEFEGQGVGFALAQADPSVLSRKSLLNRFRKREVERGRLLFLGVLPEFRGRGVARRLLSQSLETARERGWATLSVGPLPRETSAVLARWGAESNQTYTLYRYAL